LKRSAQTTAATEPPPIVLKKPDAALAGDWQGTLEIDTVKLRVRFSIQDAGTQMKGMMTSLDQGNAKVELSRVGDRQGAVHLAMDAMAAYFEGRWNEAKDELKGEWHQLDKSWPLVLKRVPQDAK